MHSRRTLERVSRTRPGGSRSAAIIAIAALCALTGVPANARAGDSIRIGTLGSTRNGAANLADGALGGDLRDSVAALGGHVIIATGTLTAGFLAGIDILLIHNASTVDVPIVGDLSSDEQDAIVDFLLGGGRVMILADGAFVSSANNFVSPLGMHVSGTLGGPQSSVVTNPNHPVTDGVFGTVSQYSGADTGWFDQLGSFATPVANLQFNDQPSLAVIAQDALAPGSGRALIMTDANPFGDADESNELFFPQNETLFRNAITWLPEPDTPVLAAAAVATIASIRNARRRSATR